MSNQLEEYRSRLRESLGIINDLKSKVATAERGKTEPIAIVGMACRFPGGSVSPDAYWDALVRGVDGVVEVPADRWSASDIDAAGSEVRWAALIDGIDRFDPSFFGISPREATSLDPQHRLLLEVTQEAIDDAGLRAESLFGSRMGVYAGICTNDYWQGIIRQGTGAVDTYGATGNLFSTAAGRISYWLGIHGPCASIDTACSSSLVAVNLACQALRSGNCDSALVGGVNAILSPFSMTMMSRLGALSPDGRCKSFDARANGYVRGEGCGVIVIKRLSDARRDGDRIHAIIIGSAVNQDGRSTGLTTPNVLSQQALLQQALENARVSPEDIGYIETHGTGTPLGDPIEIDALKRVLGKPRPNGLPCVLGAVKTNIGHLEGAAGVAGLIKAVLCLEHEAIPKNLHQRALNPRIDIEGTPFVIPQEKMSWPRSAKPRRVGISSFGISGTNAHVILEEAPLQERQSPGKEASAYLLPLSAKSPEALSALAQSYANWIPDVNDSDVLDIIYTASERRTHYEHRIAVIARTRSELVDSLKSIARKETTRGVLRGRAKIQSAPKVAFVFSGQGSQWAGMGKTLLDEEPVFRAKVEEIDALARLHTTFSILEELRATEHVSRLHDTEIAQPALFAIQVALVELFKSWGIEPHAVIGHSVGEVAAAHVCGAIALGDAVRLVVLRGRIMQKATGNGKMVWVALPAEEAARALVGLEDELSIGAINDLSSVVLSGKTATLDAVVADIQLRGIETRPLRVNYAFHSPQMEPLAHEFVQTLTTTHTKASAITLYSTVTGARIDGATLDSEYWGRNVVATVNLVGAIQAALRDDYRILVEIAPHPVLLDNLQQCIAHENIDAQVVPTLRRQLEGHHAMFEAVGALHVQGAAIKWAKLYPEGRRVVSIPAYPWQRQRYWIDGSKKIARIVLVQGQHPLVGRNISPELHSELHVWEQGLSVEAFPYLAEHRVQSEVVFPGAGYVEIANHVACVVYGEGVPELEEINFEQMLAISTTESRLIQVSLVEEGGGRSTVTISSKQEGAAEWSRHARGTIRIATEFTGPERVDMASVESRCPTLITRTNHYERMQSCGLLYGASFQGVMDVRVGSSEVVGHIRIPDGIVDDSRGYFVHPALLDACFQASIWALPSTSNDVTWLPVRVAGVRMYQRPGSELWLHARLVSGTNAHDKAISLTARGKDGEALFDIGELQIRALDGRANPNTDAFAKCIFEIVWRKADLPPEPTKRHKNRHWLIFGDHCGFGSALAKRLRTAGDRVVQVSAQNVYTVIAPDAYELNPTNAEQWGKLLAHAFGKHGFNGVVYCGALDGATWYETTEATLAADLARGPLAVLRLTQALLKQGWRDAPRLYIMTRASQSVGATEGPISVGQSMLSGMGRVIAMEQPELGCVRIDLPLEVSADESAFVMRELTADNDEDQIAMRADGRYVARLVHGSWNSDQTLPERREPAAGRPYRLEIREPGVLERLALHTMERRPPGPGEVEIEVEAAGLNFIDVLKAMGIYPGMNRSSIQLGGECAGRIVAVGTAVKHLHIGDAVIACAPCSFSSHVTIRAEFVVQKPNILSFEQGATIPTVHMTVQWALHHVGRLQRGERILIHSATGGTGLAAIQYARSMGAEVFATAGNHEKREYLRSMEIAHVMDSRTTAFANEIMDITHGRGVDVVLNSLTGSSLIQSLEVLAPYGRFLEIGKKDIYDNHFLGLRPFRKALSYTAIDLAGMADQRPELYSTLLKEVVEKFRSGLFEPAPVTVFSANEADRAFRLMAQALHIGKIAVRMQDANAEITVSNAKMTSIRSDATYLITGGLGALGLSLAVWMVEQGARSLVLIGRHVPNAAAESAMDIMRAKGATVHVHRADITQRAEVDAIIKQIGTEMPSLRGIVHAAAVLADRTLPEMTEDDLRKAIDPKMFGAWHLHEATKMISLDFFVMYSSAAGILGSPGQTNYAAANTFLDALCQARTKQGLPATSIQWGAFANVGLAAASAARGHRLAARGSESFKPEEGTNLFARAIAQPNAEICLMRFDARQWIEFHPHVAGAPFLSELVNESTNATESLPTTTFRQSIENAVPMQRLTLIEAQLLEQLGKVLRLDPGTIDKHAPFSNIGMDSLMSLELRNRLEASLGVKLSAALLFTYPTTVALSQHLLERIAPAPIVHENETTSMAPELASGNADFDTGEEAIQAGSDSTLIDKLSAFEEYLK